MESQSVTKGRYKPKNKKAPPKTKTTKKKKCEGPTCSMFLADLTRKLQLRRKQEQEEYETPTIVNTIIDTITNALPISLSKKTIERNDSPVKMETLQEMAPELMPCDIVEVSLPPQNEVVIFDEEAEQKQAAIKYPRMPVVTSEVLKPKPKKITSGHDIAINTGADHDFASEIARHVGTLRKISLIAEEFNQKTAKNLKEIVDSVQEDLIKKLEEIQNEQKLKLEQEQKMEVEKNA